MHRIMITGNDTQRSYIFSGVLIITEEDVASSSRLTQAIDQLTVLSIRLMECGLPIQAIKAEQGNLYVYTKPELDRDVMRDLDVVVCEILASILGWDDYDVSPDTGNAWSSEKGTIWTELADELDELPER